MTRRHCCDGERIPRAGVLLALPALMHSGVVDIAREVYDSIGPAFDGLRTTVVALVFLALLRIKRPESLNEHAPLDLGRLLGLVATTPSSHRAMCKSPPSTCFPRTEEPSSPSSRCSRHSVKPASSSALFRYVSESGPPACASFEKRPPR